MPCRTERGKMGPKVGDWTPEPPLVSVLARLPELSPSDVSVLPGDAMLLLVVVVGRVVIHCPPPPRLRLVTVVPLQVGRPQADHSSLLPALGAT